jgi:hypothetical protein
MIKHMAIRSSREKTEAQFLAIMGVLVFVFGAPAFMSIVKGPEAIQPTVLSTNLNTIQNGPAASTIRLPASEGVELGDSKVQKITIFEYDCNKPKTQNLLNEVSAGYLRLSGKNCLQSSELEVVNETNGFSAAIIFTNDKKLTTDFIDLQEGENKLLISSKSASGARVTEILRINRRMPASFQKTY